jgi:hypothetical protein
MQVVHLPRRLQFSAYALFLAVPLAGLQVVIAMQAQWWNLPFARVAWVCALALLLIWPFSTLMSRGRDWALTVFSALALCWVGASGFLAIRLRLPSLGYFSIFLGIFLGFLFQRLRQEMRRSFFDPRLHWYQGLPKAVPGLSCEIVRAESRIPLQVSRMDREGAFLFSPKLRQVSGSSDLFGEKAAELVFNFRHREFRCLGLPVRIMRQGAGAGFQFCELSPDARKDLGDFIENLRGEGYVE